MVWGIRQRRERASQAGDQPKAPEKLPAQLQQLVDRDEDFYCDLYSSYSVDSTETPYRYAAYANRIRTILLSAHRYVAYTSDVGESFRPVAHPWLVRSAYCISWTYLIGDVGHEGYKAYLRNRAVLAPSGEAYKDASEISQEQIFMGMATGNISGPLESSSPSSAAAAAAAAAGASTKDTLTPWPPTEIPLAEDYRMVMAKRAVFQSIASMGLPAFTIHSVVRYSGRMCKTAKNTFVRTWMPIGLGLAVVPFLPYLFDHPVEQAVDWCFHTGLRAYGGEAAVRPLLLLKSEAGTHAANTSLDKSKAEHEKALELRHTPKSDASSSGSGWMSWFGGSSEQSEKSKKE